MCVSAPESEAEDGGAWTGRHSLVRVEEASVPGAKHPREKSRN